MLRRALAQRTLNIALLLALLGSARGARAQQPFNTDDDGVTDYHKWHVEVADEYDALQHVLFPNLRQNTLNLKVAYGVVRHVEVGADEQLILIQNAPGNGLPETFSGLGDVDFDVKWHFRDEHADSRWPAMALSFSVEAPTGNPRKQLGSGLYDFVGDLIFHKSLTDKTRWNLNTGMVFAGNTATGAVGVKTRGSLFMGGTSVQHDVTRRLTLGAEVTGVASSDFNLGRGALQLLGGGNYQLRKGLTFDFGVTGGWFVGCPRIGPQLGFSYDF